ncbi:sensor histidine kinase [Blastopirellula marina]|uniref:histidine kinase n=1 Tax=Blastopirellula marina TaxID=124 RepID=A0A2S8GS47_9BACT|nr:HAMP domain-containing sensor histidine kinase [Blastopirellula marina]PQO46844.1 hypothetical protein C5Y93_06755 [Blastopirellula marina]
MKLTAKIVGIFLLGIVLLTVLFGYLTAQSEFEHYKQLQEENAASLGNEVRETLIVAWKDQGHQGAIQLVRDFANRHQQMIIRWVPTSPSPTDASPETPPKELELSPPKTVATMIRRDAAGNEQYFIYYPIDVENDRAGFVEFKVSLDEAEEYTRLTTYRTAILIGAMTLFAIGIVILGVRMVGRRLDKLVEKTKRISEGDFSEPIEIKGNDEIAELGAAVNQMSATLQTQQQELEAASSARLSAMEQLRHIDRLKTVGRLASGIAHELGTPLNVVSGRAGLIASNRLSDEEVKESALVIKSEADRMAEIIRQLLGFARRRAPQRMAVDLRELIATAINLLQPMAHQRDIELIVAESPSLTAAVDPAQIQQVVTNLIVNAIHASSPGDKVCVALDSAEAVPPGDAKSPAGKYCRIIVEDQGTGISAEAMPHLFEPFFTTKDVGEGTGLGLSVSYGIIEDHNGWIDVHSELGDGSRFTIYLPEQVA